MKYIVVERNNVDNTYITSELYNLIHDIYSAELESGESYGDCYKWFMMSHKVFQIEGHIHQVKELS